MSQQDSSPPLQKDSPALDPAKNPRLRKAIALKDYAIAKGITVSETILLLLNEAECAPNKSDYLCKNRVKIDKAISELTNFIYPTTGDTLIGLTDREQEIERFKQSIRWWLIGSALGSIGGYALLRLDPPRLTSGNIVLAASLGLLGSVMFQVFNTIGIIREKAFNIEDIYANKLRILIGPAIGWLFYLSLT